MSGLRICAVHTVRRHFGAHSGMSQLTGWLGAAGATCQTRPVLDGNVWNAAPRTPGDHLRAALNRLLQASGRPWYCATDLAAEVAMLPPWLTRGFDLLHYLDAEHSAALLPRLRHATRAGVPIVGTFHQPAAVLPGVVPASVVRALDHAVLVSETQRAWAERLTSTSRISVIPHGVDTDFFVPGDGPRGDGRCRCLVVGRYLRDWDLLRELVGMLPASRFHVDVVAGDVQALAGVPNVTCHADISDAALRECYQRADVLVLPLVDATANNALLEGLASGLPIVVSDLPATREYAPPGTAMHVRHAAGAFAAALSELAGAPDDRARLGQEARARARQLSWSTIASQYCALYERLLPGRTR